MRYDGELSRRAPWRGACLAPAVPGNSAIKALL